MKSGPQRIHAAFEKASDTEANKWESRPFRERKKIATSLGLPDWLAEKRWEEFTDRVKSKISQYFMKEGSEKQTAQKSFTISTEQHPLEEIDGWEEALENMDIEVEAKYDPEHKVVNWVVGDGAEYVAEYLKELKVNAVKETAGYSPLPDIGQRVVIKKNNLTGIDMEGYYGKTGEITDIVRGGNGYQFTVKLDDGETVKVPWGNITKEPQYGEKAEVETLADEKMEETIKPQVVEFLRENPNPSDDVLHQWAESNGLEVEEVEEVVYGLATEHVNMQGQTATKNVEELSQKEFDDIYYAAKDMLASGAGIESVAEEVAKKFDIDLQSAVDIVEEAQTNVKQQGEKADRYTNPDDTFKKMTCPDDPNGKESKFCGCVRAQVAAGKSLESAKKICAYIARRKG